MSEEQSSLKNFSEITNTNESKSAYDCPPDQVYDIVLGRCVPVSHEQKKVLHGAMTWLDGNEQVSEKSISDFNNLAKKKIALAYFTDHWTHGMNFPKAMCDAARNQGAVPFVRMHAMELKNQGKYTCKAIIAGEFDADFKRYAHATADWKDIIFIEFGTEVNGNYLCFTGEGPDAYKAAAKHIIEIFRPIAANVRWVFHGDFNDLSSHPEKWYLGDQYYDFIGSSFYGQDNGLGCIGSIKKNYTAWARCGMKPLAVLEWGLGTVDDIKNTLAQIPNYPRIQILCYWNEQGDYDRRINKTSEGLKAYQDGIVNPVYVGSIVESPPSPPPPNPPPSPPPYPPPPPADRSVKVSGIVTSVDGNTKATLDATLTLSGVAKSSSATAISPMNIVAKLPDSSAAAYLTGNISVTGSGDVPPSPPPTPPPSPPPSPPPPASNIGPDGVLQVFPTIKDGGQVFVNGLMPIDKSKFNISYGTGSHLPYTKKEENGLAFFNTEGWEVVYASDHSKSRSMRLDMYAENAVWNNTTKFSWENNPHDYLYHEAPKNIMNGEFTAYVRGHHRTGNKHFACAWKLCGRDQDNMRSVFEICAADPQHRDPYGHYDFLHFPYVSAPVKIIKKDHGSMTEDKWYGTKAVRIVDPSKKFCTFYLYEDTDPFDSAGKPRNNWQLIAVIVAAGCSQYKNVVPTWASHKDLLRVDGWSNLDFTLMSARAIDPTSKPAIHMQTMNEEMAAIKTMDLGQPEQDDENSLDTEDEIQVSSLY